MSAAALSGLSGPSALEAFLDAAPDAILVVDREGRIVVASHLSSRMFGYAREELVGRPVELLVPDRFRAGHPAHRADYAREPRTRAMGEGVTLWARRKDGTEIPVEISLSPIETEDGELVAAAIRDISERKRVENQLRSSLREKEILLKEVHHRVKNNLQIVSSMLNLQMSQLAHAEDGEIGRDAALGLLKENQARVRSIALFHEKLYQSKDLAHVDLAEYLKGVTSGVFANYGVNPDDVELSFEVEPMELGVDAAISCGLIVNELVSNALKYAFRGRRHGGVRVVLRREEHDVVLAVGDDGVGFPAGVDYRNPSTLGLKLVCILAEQVGGTLTLDAREGTRFFIRFDREKQR